MRAVLLVATAVVVLVVSTLAAATAEASSPWAAYLAPATACPGIDRAGAPPAVQRATLACLINWTRSHVGLRRLGWSKVLARAANTKASTIAACGDFSHNPCGMRWPVALPGQSRYRVWGENLYYGSLWLGTPRAAMLAWLQSREHREVVLGRAWKDLGLELRQDSTLDGQSHLSLWVLEVAGGS